MYTCIDKIQSKSMKWVSTTVPAWVSLKIAICCHMYKSVYSAFPRLNKKKLLCLPTQVFEREKFKKKKKCYAYLPTLILKTHVTRTKDIFLIGLMLFFWLSLEGIIIIIIIVLTVLIVMHTWLHVVRAPLGSGSGKIVGVSTCFGFRGHWK